MVPGRVPHRPAARGLGRAGLRRHPARRARRRRPWPAVRDRLAVPGRRLAAGTDHQRRRRGAGPPGPGAAARRPDPGGQALLYPPGSRGVPAGPGWLAAWDSLVWVLCPGRQAPPLAGPAARPAAPEPAQPTLFESALAALTGRPFGWLVVAEPTDLLDAEIAELRTQVNVLRRHDEEQSRFGAERTQRRLAELDAFREAGLWQVRVLAGAATAGGRGAAGAGAGRLGGSEPPPVPARDRPGAVPAGGSAAGQGGGPAGGGPGAVPGHRRGAGRAHGPAPLRGTGAAGGQRRPLRPDQRDRGRRRRRGRRRARPARRAGGPGRRRARSASG